MNKTSITLKIQENFKKEVRRKKPVRNAHLLVHSEKTGVFLNLAEGTEEGVNPQQPSHMASVGKLFTSTAIGISHDQGRLSFNDKITNYLDDELANNLHVYKGTDYSKNIEIRHLLN